MKSLLKIISIVILLVWVVIAIGGPELSGYKYNEGDFNMRNQAPSESHLMGTDELGRDILSRVLLGARISLMVGLASTLVSVLIGVLYGLISGYLGGVIDMVMMRFVDVVYGLPYIFFVIILMVVLGSSLWNIFIALGLVNWLTMARIVRGQVLSIKEKTFISAAIVSGSSSSKIIFKHILPNILPIVVVYAALIVPEVILYESFLSFIGIGVQPPMCSWGSLASAGIASMDLFPWMVFFPAGCLTVCLFGLNYFGEMVVRKLERD